MNRDQKKFLSQRIQSMDSWSYGEVEVKEPAVIKAARAKVSSYESAMERVRQGRRARIKKELSAARRELVFGDPKVVLAMLDKIDAQYSSGS